MSLFKYFNDKDYALAFMRKGEMRFGSLTYYRGIEDGGVRGDPKDGMLHYAAADGIEITMVADSRKLTGTSFTSAAESMLVYCASNDRSAERATGFGEFCVEITEPKAILRRLKARASVSSRIDYERIIWARRSIALSIKFLPPIGLSRNEWFSSSRLNMPGRTRLVSFCR